MRTNYIAREMKYHPPTNRKLSSTYLVVGKVYENAHLYATRKCTGRDVY